MGSEGIFRAGNRRELAFFYEYAGRDVLVQRCAAGREYTIDVLCDFFGETVYIVPRIRLEVISGACGIEGRRLRLRSDDDTVLFGGR